MLKRSFTNSHASTAATHLDEEDDASEHSFDHNKGRHDHKKSYSSTNLIASRNITLADVIVEEATSELINERHVQAAHHARNCVNPYGVVDPRE
jgi:hypothetical protein